MCKSPLSIENNVSMKHTSHRIHFQAKQVSVGQHRKFTWPTNCEMWLCCRMRRRLHWDCPRLRLCAPYGTSCPTYWDNTRNPTDVDPPYRSALDCLLSTQFYYFCGNSWFWFSFLFYRSCGLRASFIMTAAIRASIGQELFSLWLWWLGCCVVMAVSRRAGGQG